MLHLTKLTLATVLFSTLPLLADPPASLPATAPLTPPLTWKTPDGLATMVQSNDTILAAPPATPPTTFPAMLKPDPAYTQKLLTLIDDSLTHLAEKSSDKDPQYYDNGTWHFTNQVVACQGGPAGLAAMLWKYRQSHRDQLTPAQLARQDFLYHAAVDSFERIISDHQQPDGSLKNPGSHQVFVFSEMANTYLLLQDTFDKPTRDRWLASMKKAVDFMQQTGEIPNPALTGWKATDGWYTNGNVELSEATFLYSLYLATQDQTYKNLFELQWTHILSPSQQRWKGFGLFYIKYPTRPDGSDGAAFVTEKGGGDPGFDPEYGQFQLSLLGRLYLISHDPRVLRLTNLILNAELAHVDPNTMNLNGTYGSRHNTILPFAVGTLGIIVQCGHRPDLQPLLQAQFDKALKPFFLNNATQNQGAPGIYRGYGFDLEPLLETIAIAEH